MSRSTLVMACPSPIVEHDTAVRTTKAAALTAATCRAEEKAEDTALRKSTRMIRDLRLSGRGA